MARIHELLRQLRLTNEALAEDIEREVDVLGARRAFGLNFERHTPEAVELPGRPIRIGDKVHILAPRGETSNTKNEELWRVVSITGKGAERMAELEAHPRVEPIESTIAPASDVVVVAEFRDPIYPGLVSTGKLERGGDKPFHTVVNGENFHALQTLLFTHRGKVDLIYIDPPYNTGNEWIYNDKYVASSDYYRHSKWLAFLERRLLLARELLAPSGVLCISIGSDEMHRLKLLVEQTFRHLTVQLITVQVTAGGKSTAGINTLNEYLICATPEGFVPQPTSFTGGVSRTPWEGLVLATFDKTQRPNQTYPIFVNTESGVFHSVGPSLAAQMRDGSFVGDIRDFRFEVDAPVGTTAIWPITTKDEERVWRLAPNRFVEDWEKGYIKVSMNRRQGAKNRFSLQYLPSGVIAKVESGAIPILGTEEGRPTLSLGDNETAGAAIPSIWMEKGHRTTEGNEHLKTVLRHKRFPYPKPLPLISDVVRGFTSAASDAIVLDFFGGSGTTTEAVAYANSLDGGRRQSILVTNNEISAEESSRLRAAGYRRGDVQWEARGVFEYVARPRILTTISGLRDDNSKFSDGYLENVEFFSLKYQAPLRLRANRDFQEIAPLLWLRAGSRGRRIEQISSGWDVAEAYGVIADLDRTDEFFQALTEMPSAAIAFVITDDNGLFEAIVAGLPSGVEPVRLYDAYLRNFEIDAMRGVR